MIKQRATTEFEKAQRREKLLDAAIEIFFQKGFHATRLEDIPHCQNSCHPHLNNPNGEKGDNHGTIQCRTQTSYTEQTFIT